MDLPPRLASLVVKQGLSLTLLGHDERSLLLALAASTFEVGRDYREAAVNATLAAWLVGPGAMLPIDHVELRRWLVDTRFIARDGYGRAYVRDAASAQRSAALLGSDDSAALARAIDAHRAESRRVRDARRRAFEER